MVICKQADGGIESSSYFFLTFFTSLEKKRKAKKSQKMERKTGKMAKWKFPLKTNSYGT